MAPNIMTYGESMINLVVRCCILEFGRFLETSARFHSHSETLASNASLTDFAYSYYMMTSSNGNNFRVPGPFCGEFTGNRWIPPTKASDVELWCFLHLRLNKRLSKQSRHWWFETPSYSWWRHLNDTCIIGYQYGSCCCILKIANLNARSNYNANDTQLRPVI